MLILSIISIIGLENLHKNMIVTNKVKNSDKEKWVYSVCRIAINGKGTLRFGNDYAKNVIIFGVDNNSSSHTDKLQEEFFSVR